MTPFRLALCAGIALILATPAAPILAQSTPAAAAAKPTTDDVEPAAVQALARMSSYLATQTAFDITARTSVDLVLTDGQKVKLDGNNHYTVRRPDGFIVEVATAAKTRRLIYDGKTLTLVSPELGYYASVEAPATIRETLDAAADRYGLHIPLQDLFRWTDPAMENRAAFQSALVVGPGKVDGHDAIQYAFREAEVDWQIWIRDGDKPVPLKVVIIDRNDPAHPQYEATLTWNPTTQITKDSFTYRPDKGALPIRLTSLKPQ
jgi:hypothetical protein